MSTYSCPAPLKTGRQDSSDTGGRRDPVVSSGKGCCTVLQYAPLAVHIDSRPQPHANTAACDFLYIFALVVAKQHGRGGQLHG